MRRLITLFLSVIAICCVGCTSTILNSSPTDSVTSSVVQHPTFPTSTATIPTSTTPTVSYNEPAILHINQVYPCYTPEKPMPLNAECTDALISLWRDLRWGYGTTKTAYDFVFECDSSTIHYSSQYGLFNDIQNDRSLKITEGQRISINFLLVNSFYTDEKVEVTTPSGFSQCIVELTSGGYYYKYPNTSYAPSISFSLKTQESYEQLKYHWEHKEEFSNYTLEKIYDPEQEMIVYRYTRGNGDSMMIVVYTFKTEDYSYTIYEEYVLNESENIPCSVKILGTNDQTYFYVAVYNPSETVSKEWISMWGIKTTGESMA